MCEICVQLEDPDKLLNQSATKFRCISCHLTSSTRDQAYYVSLLCLPFLTFTHFIIYIQPLYRNDQPIETVFGTIMPTSIRANYPRMNTDSIAVLELRLSTIRPEGSPYFSVKNDLDPFFINSSEDRQFLYSEFRINVDPENPKSLAAHQNKLAAYVKMLSM